MTGVAVDVSVVVVAYNSEDIIHRTISVLRERLSELSGEIVVVDNASTDSTLTRARDALGPADHVIRSEVNLGFGRGANLGIQVARGRHVVIMNDDVFPQQLTIERLIEVAESDEHIGLVGAEMRFPDGSRAPATRRSLPGWRDEFERIVDRFRRSSARNAYPAGQQPREVGLLIAAFVLGRTELLRSIGGFSDAYFMYGEDIDLCRRLQDLNLRRVTVPGAVAVHHQDTAEARRIRGRDFNTRILDARHTYYRIWMSRLGRSLMHLYLALASTDQPFRWRYHTGKLREDCGDLRHLRRPAPLEPIRPPGIATDVE